MRIGIIGMGFVGQAVYSGIRDKSMVTIYDPQKGYNDSVLDCDFVFVCVSTPTKKSTQDNEAIEATMMMLKDFKGIVIIKSTVLPQNIAKYNVVANPEFLNQNNAIKDFAHQKLLILGGDITKTSKVYELYKKHFDIVIGEVKFCSVAEAFYIKYIHNLYHAYKVLFWDYVQSLTGNERFYADAYKKLVPNGNEMDRIYADGKRGFGGACFPKDLVALHGKTPHAITKYMIEYNKMIRPDEMGAVL